MNFSFKTDYSLIFIFAIVIVSILIAYLYYRKSNLVKSQKIFFTTLRFLSVLFILLLLSSPVISFISKITRTPINIFLIDNSQSLLIEDREKKLKENLENNFSNISGEKFYYLFSENILKEIKKDELSSINYSNEDNFKTNLTSTLNSLQEKLSDKNLSSITIISDGIINDGGNPVYTAKSMNVPFNYFLIGDTIQKNDLVLKNIFYNKTSFIESSVPIKLEINSFGYDRSVKVNLLEEGSVIDSKEIKVSKAQMSYQVDFNITSGKEGVKKYKAEVEKLDDEITQKNNYEEFLIKFVDNKFKLLVLSGGPSSDFAYLSEEMKKIKNFEITFMTQKSQNEFYEGKLPDLKDFDSFILSGFPTAISNSDILNEIKKPIEKNKSSLIFISSRNTDYQKLSLLENELPFHAANFSQTEEETSLKFSGNFDNEIFRNQNLISSINSFPNVFKTKSLFSVNPSAETFLLAGSEPALIIENTNTKKSAAFLFYGFYKWRLNGKNLKADEVMSNLISSTVIALTNKEEKKKFFIETTKPVYSKFENVHFNASLTSPEISGDEKIKVIIEGKNFNSSLELTRRSNNFFEGEIKIPDDGDYNYTAELYSQNNKAESISNRFVIGEDNFEYKFTKADNAILNSLSNETNGNNFSHILNSEMKNILKTQNEKSVSEYKAKQNFDLNINPYYLFAVIFLLCLEWFLRKRNNLP